MLQYFQQLAPRYRTNFLPDQTIDFFQFGLVQVQLWFNYCSPANNIEHFYVRKLNLNVWKTYFQGI